VKLDARQLSSHLSSGVAPLYLVSGDEPLLVGEALDAIRSAARQHGYAEREFQMAERSFDWISFEAGLQNMSLFAERRLIEIRLPTGKPGDQGARFLAAVCDAPVPDTTIVVVTPKLDSRIVKNKWVKAFASKGVWIRLVPPGPEAMPAWIAGRLKKTKLTADSEALDLLASRVEGNLLAAKQEIDKLVLLVGEGRITVDKVRTSVTDGARFDVFQLTDAALAGDPPRAARVLLGLEREGVAAALVMWSLAREIGTLADVAYRVGAGASVGKAMADAGVWQGRQRLIGRAARSRNPAAAKRLIERAAATERIVKNSNLGQPWNALMELTLELAGSESPA
jgi:DNA polymerase-3 subunit delta